MTPDEERATLPKGEWTKPTKINVGISGVAPIIASVTAYSNCGNFLNNRNTTAENQAKAQQAKQDEQTKDLIIKQLSPISENLEARKDADSELQKAVEGLTTSQSKGFEGIQTEVARTNDLARGAKEDLAKLSAKVDGIEKNVDRLLNIQLKTAASLPPAVLAPQIANVYALYEVAQERNVQIPDDTNNLLRMKLASVESNDQDFWPLSSTVITRASQASTGKKVSTGPTLRNVFIEHNSYQGAHVFLDGIHFIGNVCIGCIIEYRGGATETAGNVFVDCLFIIVIPPKRATTRRPTRC